VVLTVAILVLWATVVVVVAAAVSVAEQCNK